MAAQRFEKTFPSELYLLKQVLAEVLAFTKTCLPGLSEDELFDLRLVFMELLCNAVIHGNKQDVHKSVRIEVEIFGDTVKTRIADEGMGFDHRSLLNMIDASDNLDEENGRGMRLVHKLTDALSFNAKGNVINFCKKVARNEQNTGG